MALGICKCRPWILARLLTVQLSRGVVRSAALAALAILASVEHSYALHGDEAGSCHPSLNPADIRISLVSFSALIRLETDPIVTEVDRIWSANGVRLAWTVGGDSPQPSRQETDVRVHLLDSRHRLPATAGPRHPVFGAVTLADGQPDILIRVSVSALLNDLGQHFRHERAARFFPSLTVHREFLERAVARTVAHEIGHVVLRSREHSSEGLMRARIPAAGLALGENEAFVLDPSARARLGLHLTKSQADCINLAIAAREAWPRAPTDSRPPTPRRQH